MKIQLAAQMAAATELAYLKGLVVQHSAILIGLVPARFRQMIPDSCAATANGTIGLIAQLLNQLGNLAYAGMKVHGDIQRTLHHATITVAITQTLPRVMDGLRILRSVAAEVCHAFG